MTYRYIHVRKNHLKTYSSDWTLLTRMNSFDPNASLKLTAPWTPFQVPVKIGNHLFPKNVFNLLNKVMDVSDFDPLPMNRCEKAMCRIKSSLGWIELPSSCRTDNRIDPCHIR